MSKFILNMTMSQDGFIAGPNVRPEEPMGDNGEQLHDWMFSGEGKAAAKAIIAEYFNNTGAFIMGRRTFDLGLSNWGENPPYHTPVFVLSGKSQDTITKQGGTSYIFITDGIESALRQAREAAGNRDVIVMGGANAAQQYVNAGLLDELHLHISNILLGSGTKLFDKLTIAPTQLEKIGTADTPGATHLKFRVLK